MDFPNYSKPDSEFNQFMDKIFTPKQVELRAYDLHSLVLLAGSLDQDEWIDELMVKFDALREQAYAPQLNRKLTVGVGVLIKEAIKLDEKNLLDIIHQAIETGDNEWMRLASKRLGCLQAFGGETIEL